jgi:hypothetical protein
MTGNRVSAGRELFGRYAYPPNELGYCGPTDGGAGSGLASHAREFDGAWPYLSVIADALGGCDALDEDVVASYWIGGQALAKVDPAQLLARLRAAFAGQLTGLLETVPASTNILAHHSFHVFVVYPWVKFLSRDAATSVKIMQDCRIRWGTVQSIADEHAVIASRPLEFSDAGLTLGEPRSERVRWRKGDLSLAPPPEPGAVVSAHWDWVCETLTDDGGAALEHATRMTLELVNSFVSQGVRI